jgi:hypothetical protein
MAVGNRDPRDVSTILRVLFFRAVYFHFKTGDGTGDGFEKFLSLSEEKFLLITFGFSVVMT